jgi:hypothetical protein
MSDQEASLVFIELARNLEFFRQHPLIRYGGASRWTLRKFLDHGCDSLGALLDDPVVLSFLEFIQVEENTVADVAEAIRKLSFKSVQEHWPLCRPANGGNVLDVIDKIRQHGIHNLHEFIRAICISGFDEPYQKAMESVNYLDTGVSNNLYSISIQYNIITKYIQAFKLTLTDDKWFDGSLLSFSMNNVNEIIHYALQREIQGLKQPKDKLYGRNMFDCVFFKSAMIKVNGQDLVNIPLRFEGDEKAQESTQFTYADRVALSTKGASAYSLDFAVLEILGGTEKELRALAKMMPHEAAQKLNGAALSDSLGL